MSNDLYKQTTYEQAQKRLNSRYYNLVKRAEKAGRECTITVYEFGEILARPCDYCGEERSGIDRKDNSKGYTIENSTPCCYRCNSMKGSQLDYQEMKELGHEIKEADAGSFYD